MEEVIFWRGGEEAAVIDIELALLQIDEAAEALYVPVLLALGEHLQPQTLEQGIEMLWVLLLHYLCGQAAADGEEQQRDQGIDGLLPEGKAGKLLLLQAGDAGVDLDGILRVEDGILRHGKAPGRTLIGRKVKIAVAEPVDGLVVLGAARGIEDAGVLLCDGDSVSIIDLHGGLEQEEQIIPASPGAEDGVEIVVRPVVFAEIQCVHGALLLMSLLRISISHDRKKSQMKRKKGDGISGRTGL